MTENEKSLGDHLRNTNEQITEQDLDKFESRGEVVPHETPQLDRSALIELAVRQGSDLTQLEKLMELQERHEANEAKKAFHVAMSDFKREMPVVLKDRLNKQFDSKYASEDALINTINPALSKYGLNAQFSFPPQEGNIFSVTCSITHKFGHSESVTIPGPLDTSGAKNELQQVRSTVTYLRKVAFEAITGIATSDPSQDDNGNDAGTFINEKQLSTITDMINNLNADEAKFCEVMGVESLDKIPASDFNKAMKKLREKERKIKDG